MARKRQRQTGATAPDGAQPPAGRQATAAAASPAGPQALPEERALFLHLMRALAREAARADHAAEHGDTGHPPD